MVAGDVLTFNQILFNAIVVGSTYLLAAMSLTLIFGILDIADFAQGAVYMMSAYLAYFLITAYSLSYFVVLGVVALAAGLLSVLNGYLVYRPLWRKGSAAGTLVAALGLLIIMENVVAYRIGTTIRTIPSYFEGKVAAFGLVFTHHRIFVIILSILIVGFLYVYLERTMTGRALRGMAQDSELAQLSGVPTKKVYVLTFFIGGLMTGLAGGLIAPLQTVEPQMGLDLILIGFIIVVLGGFGSVKGTFVAAYIIAFVEALTSGYVSTQYSTFAAFVILVLVIMYKPSGLFGSEVNA